MGKAGILTEDDRVELIEGEIVQMPPIGSPHASGVRRVTRLFYVGLGDAAVVSVQDPLRLSNESEPVPDVILLRPRPDFYAAGHPTAADVLLLVEVSDTTLAYDLRRKVPLYAREGVPEVWVVDLNGQRILVYRDPSPTGYQMSLILQRGDHLAPLAFPDLDFAINDILG
jgi:Uma2 family endonuclease